MCANAEALRQTEQIPQWKQDEVDALLAFLDRYESVGIVSFAGIPSRQLQLMRRELHGNAELRVSRNSLLDRALADHGEGLEALRDELAGQIGLIGTNDNPFALYRQLEASKTPAPISAGEVAPNDIVIDAGDTGMDPGPFVGDLQQVGAAARIMEGSIRVTEDSVVAETGDVISEQLAGVLNELEIEPKEVGLDLRLVYSEGILFEAEDLELDLDEYRSDVQSAIAAARSLSIATAFPTAATTPDLLRLADQDARAVAIAAAIEDPDVMPDLLRKADAQLRALAAQVADDDALPEELRGGAVEAAPAAEPEESDDESEPEEAAPDEEDEDDEDEDGAAGLGAMFG